MARGLVASSLLLGALFIAAFIAGVAAQSNNGLDELAGLTAGAALLRLAVAKPTAVQLAIFAQTADLVTFAFAWHDGRAEGNPIARWVVDVSTTAFAGSSAWFASLAAGLVLVLMKVVLVGLLIVLLPRLGRYRPLVSVIAVGAGLLGAASNLLALG